MILIIILSLTERKWWYRWSDLSHEKSFKMFIEIKMLSESEFIIVSDIIISQKWYCDWFVLIFFNIHHIFFSIFFIVCNSSTMTKLHWKWWMISVWITLFSSCLKAYLCCSFTTLKILCHDCHVVNMNIKMLFLLDLSYCSDQSQDLIFDSLTFSSLSSWIVLILLTLMMIIIWLSSTITLWTTVSSIFRALKSTMIFSSLNQLFTLLRKTRNRINSLTDLILKHLKSD